MKRSPLQRRTPLKRTRMKRKARSRRQKAETPAEKKWRSWVHLRRCVGTRSFTGHVCGPTFLASRPQMAHFRDMTGAGLKESNLLTLPMCASLHYDYDNARGVFAPMGKPGRKAWFMARLIEERADWVAEFGDRPWENESLA